MIFASFKRSLGLASKLHTPLRSSCLLQTSPCLLQSRLLSTPPKDPLDKINRLEKEIERVEKQIKGAEGKERESLWDEKKQLRDEKLLLLQQGASQGADNQLWIKQGEEFRLAALDSSIPMDPCARSCFSLVHPTTKVAVEMLAEKSVPGDHQVYVRECSPKLWRFIERLFVVTSKPVLLLGTAGTGKTAFGLLVLVRMLKKQAQADESNKFTVVYEVGFKGVSRKMWKFLPDGQVLYWGPGEAIYRGQADSEHLQARDVHIADSCFPSGSSKADQLIINSDGISEQMKERSKQAEAIEIFSPLPKLNEVPTVVRLQYPGVPQEDLDNATSIAGSNFRLAARLCGPEEERATAYSSISRNVHRCAQQIARDGFIEYSRNTELPSKVVHIDTDDFVNTIQRFASLKVARRVLGKADKISADKVRQFLLDPALSGFFGTRWEEMSLEWQCMGEHFNLYCPLTTTSTEATTMTTYQVDSKLTEEFQPDRLERKYTKDLGSISKDINHVDVPTMVHFHSKTVAGIDALVASCNFKSGVLLLQHTVAEEKKVKRTLNMSGQSGVRAWPIIANVWWNLLSDDEKRTARECKTAQMPLAFVIPEERASLFKVKADNDLELTVDDGNVSVTINYVVLTHDLSTWFRSYEDDVWLGEDDVWLGEDDVWLGDHIA